jgi:hypothetical protein
MKKLTAFLLSSLLIFTSCEDEIIDPNELVLQGTLTEDKTLTKDKLWTLKGYVFVPEGITLTIEEGTTIHSDIAENVVERLWLKEPRMNQSYLHQETLSHNQVTGVVL